MTQNQPIIVSVGKLICNLYFFQIKYYSKICITGETWDTATIFYIIIERKISIECLNFLDALECLIAIHFVLNLVYIDKFATLLEVIQRYVFKINPASGIRSKKSKLTKVLSFVEMLNRK